MTFNLAVLNNKNNNKAVLDSASAFTSASTSFIDTNDKKDKDNSYYEYEAILAVLPQTQCTQCGYAGCAPYAKAIAAKETNINRCPPGGQAGVAALAALTGLPVQPIAPECGVTQPRHIAVIDPSRCIGCTLCMVACPVDAIVGAAKALHQVINQACTGCDLCLPPCPVDCISMERLDDFLDWTVQDAIVARHAHDAKIARLQAIATNAISLVQPPATVISTTIMPLTPLDEAAKKYAAQQAALSALEKARSRRQKANHAL